MKHTEEQYEKWSEERQAWAAVEIGKEKGKPAFLYFLQSGWLCYMGKSPSLQALRRHGPTLRIKWSSRQVILDLFKKVKMQISNFSRKYNRVLLTGQAFLHQLDPQFYPTDQNLMLPQILLNGIACILNWIIWLLQFMLAGMCHACNNWWRNQRSKLYLFTTTECCVVFKVLNTMTVKLLMLLYKASY